MKKLFLLVAIFCLASNLHAELSVRQQATLAELVAKFQEKGEYPAVSVLIDQGGETLYLDTRGLANIEYGISVTEDSAFAIGSITKSFTALASLILVEKGDIDILKTVKEYLPEYQGPASKVTVQQLLSHTSGIPNYTGEIPGLADQLKRTAFTRKEMVAHFAPLPLAFEPGEKFSYTNSGYYLLGLIIESVSGQDYYDFLKQNIFDPLAMTRTFSGADSEIISGRVGGYALGKEGLVNAAPWSHLVPFSAGSLVSTLGDMVRYRRGVFHNPEFSNVRELVLTQVNLNDGTKNIYALGGLILSNTNGISKVSHSGDIWGFAANHAYYPEKDLTVVILTNRQAEAPTAVSLEQKIARVIFDIPQPIVKDNKLSESELNAYTGDYLLHPFVFGPPVYGFLVNDGRLNLRFGGIGIEQSPMIPLFAQGDGQFVTSFDDEWTFRFFIEPDGTRRFESHARDGVFYASEVKVDK